ncbi:MAG: triose-phosphate isomerase [Haliscomenobacter sp.]
MSRVKIAAGNWQMNTTLEEGRALAEALVAGPSSVNGIVVLCTPFTHLSLVGSLLEGKPGFYLGAQNCHQEAKGAYTGEISVSMLQSVGVQYVILGHSERREYFGESDALLASKVDTVLAAGLTPIFCCGEALPVREAGTHLGFVRAQVAAALFHLSPEQFGKLVIAYEPIWAIGTGRTASPEQAQEMHASIRGLIAEKYGQSVADGVSILYGGSVNAANAATLFGQADVDGGLVGGASLKATEFMEIIKAM